MTYSYELIDLEAFCSLSPRMAGEGLFQKRPIGISWLKVFKGDNRIIMQASKQARIAAEYILTGEMPKILVAQAATGEAAIA